MGFRTNNPIHICKGTYIILELDFEEEKLSVIWVELFALHVHFLCVGLFICVDR